MPSHSPSPLPLSQNGITALICASTRGHVEVAKLLVEGGAALDVANQVCGVRAKGCMCV